MTALDLAVRELRHLGWKLAAVVMILFIGFIGPLVSSSLKSSVSDYLNARSRQILSADLAMGAQRAFKDEEVERAIETLSPLHVARETELVTMVRGAEDASSLVEVKAIDEKFPVYGKFELSTPSGPMTLHDASDLKGRKDVWVYPEVLSQLRLKIGDEIAIGQSKFVIRAEVREAPGFARTVGVAPRVFIHREFLSETGLTQSGSQVFHRVYFGLDSGENAETASARLKAALQSDEISMRTPDEAIRGFERFFKFFNLYLVSITMIVFILSWVSAFYILQVFLQERLRTSAILIINGASRTFAARVAFYEVFAQMFMAYLVALVLVGIAARLVNSVSALELPEGFVYRVGLSDAIGLGAVAALSSLAFLTPFATRLAFLRPQRLLGESALGVERVPPSLQYASYTPLILIFLGLASWLMNSFVEALRLAGGMAAVALVGWFVGRMLFRFLFKIFRHRPGRVRLVATALARSRFGMNLCFLALTLIALSLNLVPHLLASAINEIQPLQGRELPALFLINIPEGEVENLQKFANERQVELRFLAPMVVARLTGVNGQEPKAEQFRKFPVRLSYRNELIGSERLIKGRLPGAEESSSGLPMISVEQRFAERNDFTIGDTLEFEVQGIPVQGRVASLRKVRWTDFNPNFFMIFENGVLDEAPKTYLANVNMDDAENRKARFQSELVRAFPDLSVIDVGRTITKVLEIAQSVIGPVTAAAWIAVVMSFLVLLGIITHNLRMRDDEIDVHKLLGANRSLIRGLFTAEYTVTSFLAWCVGFLGAIAIAWTVTTAVFEVPLRISWWAALASLIATVSVTFVISFVSSTRVLSLRGASRKL